MIEDALEQVLQHPGQTYWLCSEEDGGPDVGVGVVLDDEAHLYSGDLTRRSWEDAGIEASALGPDTGTWLTLYTKGQGVRVLGKMVSAEAGRDFIEAIAAAIRKGEA